MPAARERRSWWASALGLLVAAGTAGAQGPVLRPVPVDPPRSWITSEPAERPILAPARRPGAIRHVGRFVHDNGIGVPDLFVEPPLGAPLNDTFAAMRHNAAGHVFTLYRSDFLVDTATLTPLGAGRMSRICGDLRLWRGPVVVEATPDKPALAEARREAILAHLRRFGHDAAEGLVVVGPPVAPGMLGADAGMNYQVLMIRDQMAPSSFTLTPAQSTSPGGAGGSR